MKLQAPPFYTTPVHAADDGLGSNSSQDNTNTNIAYHDYYGSQLGANNPHAPEQADESSHPTSSGAVHQQFHQRQLLGQQYYDYYRTAQTIYNPNDCQGQHAQQKRVEDAIVYDPNTYDQQYTSPEAEACDHPSCSDDRLEQKYEGSCSEEVAHPPPPSSPSPSPMKKRNLANVFSLAHNLLPTRTNRLDQDNELLSGIDNDEDDYPYDDDCSGIDEEEGEVLDDVVEACDVDSMSMESDDYDDSDDYPMTEYLPQMSASSFPIPALQVGSYGKIKKYDDGNRTNIPFTKIPSPTSVFTVITDVASFSESAQEFFNRSLPPPRMSNTLEMESHGREADNVLFLQSVHKDDLNGRREVNLDSAAILQGLECSQDGFAVDAAAARATATTVSTISSVADGTTMSSFINDDDSIRGDTIMARQTTRPTDPPQQREETPLRCMVQEGYVRQLGRFLWRGVRTMMSSMRTTTHIGKATSNSSDMAV